MYGAADIYIVWDDLQLGVPSAENHFNVVGDEYELRHPVGNVSMAPTLLLKPLRQKQVCVSALNSSSRLSATPLRFALRSGDKGISGGFVDVVVERTTARMYCGSQSQPILFGATSMISPGGMVSTNG